MPTPQTTPDAPLTIHTDPPPVRVDEHGRYRVGQTRVLLDLVVHAYAAGATAERIVEMYGTLTPADVYGAIAYYLRHKPEIDEYLRKSDERADELRRQVEQEFGGTADRMRQLRERHAARQQAQGAGE